MHLDSDSEAWTLVCADPGEMPRLTGKRGEKSVTDTGGDDSKSEKQTRTLRGGAGVGTGSGQSRQKEE